MPGPSQIPPLTSFESNGLLAQQVARRIQEWIAAKALRSGDFLGREPDLGGQLGISRPTLRAAIRFLEISGRVTTRPGVHGGVFVAAPDATAVVAVLTRHIVALGQTLPVFLSVHMPFFAHAAGLAAVRANTGQRVRMAELTAKMLSAQDTLAAFRPIRLELRQHLLEATGLSAMALVGGALMRAYMRILDGELKLRETEAEKVRLVKSVDAGFFAPLIAGNRAATLAAFEIASELEKSVTLQTIRDGMGPKSAVPLTLFGNLADAPGTTRLAGHLERALRRDIHFSYPPGTPIGSITEIAIRYGVSQEICREALGLLSLHGLVTIRRGNGGGVFAGKRSLDRIAPLIDSALVECSGLPDLLSLLREIRDALPGRGFELPDTSSTLEFLDQLADRVAIAMSAIG